MFATLELRTRIQLGHCTFSNRSIATRKPFLSRLWHPLTGTVPWLIASTIPAKVELRPFALIMGVILVGSDRSLTPGSLVYEIAGLFLRRAPADYSPRLCVKGGVSPLAAERGGLLPQSAGVFS